MSKKGIELNVNNGDTLFIDQTSADGETIVSRYNGDKMAYEYTIPAGDMVMLLNLYRHIKQNDIQNDFINYDGNREKKAINALSDAEEIIFCTKGTNRDLIEIDNDLKTIIKKYHAITGATIC